MLCDDVGMQRHVIVSRDPNVNWNNDDIQFPRLLAELAGVVTLDQLEEVSASMDLAVGEVEAIFERAEATWEDIKRRTT
jgi:hypothetical protein